jgi:hypothetical protein
MNIKKLKELRQPVCKGCHSFSLINKDRICRMEHKRNGYNCPCSTCLIKMVCNEMCEKALIHSGGRESKLNDRNFRFDYEWNYNSNKGRVYAVSGLRRWTIWNFSRWDGLFMRSRRTGKTTLYQSLLELFWSDW